MRHLEANDFAAVAVALLALEAKSVAAHMKFSDFTVAMESVRRAANDGLALIFGGYFVLLDKGPTWYSKREFLIEQIVLKVHPNVHTWSLQDVIKFLPKIATWHGCCAVVTGDTQVGYMAQQYATAGYHCLGNQFIMEV